MTKEMFWYMAMGTTAGRFKQ